jgi:hypothetical protein
MIELKDIRKAFNTGRENEPLAKLPLHDLLRRSIRPRGAICLVREVSVPELLT